MKEINVDNIVFDCMRTLNVLKKITYYISAIRKALYKNKQ